MKIGYLISFSFLFFVSAFPIIKHKIRKNNIVISLDINKTLISSYRDIHLRRGSTFLIKCLSSFSTVVLYTGSSINHATKYIKKADIGSYISEVYSVKTVIPKSKFKDFEIVKRDFNLKTIKQILHFDDDTKYLKEEEKEGQKGREGKEGREGQEKQFVCIVPFDH